VTEGRETQLPTVSVQLVEFKNSHSSLCTVCREKVATRVSRCELEPARAICENPECEQIVRERIQVAVMSANHAHLRRRHGGL
jgi:hypothetical protein